MYPNSCGVVVYFTYMLCRNFFSGELRDFALRDYRSKGNKRIRVPYVYPDDISLITTFGSG